MYTQIKSADWDLDGNRVDGTYVIDIQQDGQMRPVSVEEVPSSRIFDFLKKFPETISSNRYKVVDLIKLAQKLPGLDVLDLGCGSYERRDQGVIYPPRLCEELHALGAHVTGVDRPYEDGTHKGEWSFVPLNLLDPSVLSVFPSNSMDIVNMHSLIGHSNPCLTSPALGFFDLNNPFYKALESKLFTQVIRILRPGGLMVINDEHVYQRDGGPLTFEFKDLVYKRVLGVIHLDESCLKG